MSSTGDGMFPEILSETKEINHRLDQLEEVKALARAASGQNNLIAEQNKILSQIVEQQKEAIKAIEQMSEYLRDYQTVVNFALKDSSKNNEQLLKELRVQFMKAAALLTPELVGQTRSPNFRPISDENIPVYTLTKSLQIRKAETSLIPSNTTDAAYYRVGFKANLSTNAYQTLDEGYPTLVNTVQQLQLVSTSTSDIYPGGSGVRTVLVGGLDINNKRIFEWVNLNGTTPVTSVNQFTQCDILNSSAAGSNSGAVGTISLQSVGGATTFGAIAAGENNWRSGRLFTDMNVAAYVFSWTIGSFNAVVRAQLVANHIAGNPNAILERNTAIVNNDTVCINFPIPIKIPKQSLVEVRGISKGDINEAVTAFQLYVRHE